MNHISTQAVNGAALIARLAPLTTEAVTFLADGKLEQITRQLLVGARYVVRSEHATEARVLAIELGLASPSMLGSTAFDRLSTATRRRKVLAPAYTAGKAAGEKFEYHAGIEAA